MSTTPERARPVTARELMALGPGTRFFDVEEDADAIEYTLSEVIFSEGEPIDFRYTFVVPPAQSRVYRELFAWNDDYTPGDLVETRDASFGSRGACYWVVES